MVALLKTSWFRGPFLSSHHKSSSKRPGILDTSFLGHTLMIETDNLVGMVQRRRDEVVVGLPLTWSSCQDAWLSSAGR